MATQDWIDELLDGAACWGAELETTYRVLAVTVEPTAQHHPDGDVADRRLQLLLHPCSEVEARMVHRGDTIERFTVDQLVDVVGGFDGAPLSAPVVTADPPPLAGELSLQGAAKATVTDGRRHAALFRLANAERQLSLRVTYDLVELRRPDGSTVAPPDST